MQRKYAFDTMDLRLLPAVIALFSLHPQRWKSKVLVLAYQDFFVSGHKLLMYVLDLDTHFNSLPQTMSALL